MPVNVAVRLRPTIKDDPTSDSCANLDPDTSQVILNDPEGGHEKRFKFKYCYNSFVDPSHRHHAGDNAIWDELGEAALGSAMQGVDSTILFGGQTNSGKSHTKRCLIQAAFEKVFDGIENNYTSELRFEVEFTAFEIYCEVVTDLMMPLDEQEPLAIREHSLVGPFITGLSRHTLESLESFKTLFAEFEVNRALKHTSRNTNSWQAHTVVQLVVRTLTATGAGTEKVTQGLISFVELGGMECIVQSNEKVPTDRCVISDIVLQGYNVLL
jgi:kinesin family protein 13